MRSIETLVREYPDKTGAEILEIQSQDIQKDKEEFEKLHSEKLETIEKINSGNSYFRGSFGLVQYFYYSFSNARLINSEIIVDVETILCFDDDAEDDISFSKKFKTYEELDRYGFERLEEITEEKYKMLVNHLKQTVNSFWNTSYLK